MVDRPGGPTHMELDQLIETEQHLDRALQQAREEFGRMIEAARSAAQSREAALEAELSDRIQARAVAAAADRRRREEEIARDTARQVARYDAVTDERVRTLARAVIDVLVAAAAA